MTEAFVRNGLAVVNRELGAEFNQRRLAFVARWDQENEWMDIGFRATVAHTVPVAELDVTVPLAAGEPLRLEISAKFRRKGVERDLAGAGLEIQEWWTDRAGDFAVLLASRSPAVP